ncbi:MAG: DNA recombination protein RmuC [Tyzzerella sp.]|nr:DNA recombination protein RmuC [Tyzzerella sp.]
MEYIIIALLIIAIIIEVVILAKANAKKDDKSEVLLNNLKDMKKDQDTLKIDVIKEISEGQFKNQETIRRSLMEMQESTEKRLLANSTTVNKSIAEGLSTIQEATDRKLTEIQKNVDAKLDKNLNERLDESFKQVGERLESLYKSLGELKSLESGVVNLNKTLSNVKARGVYGEMALENILANILDNSQYDTNVATKPRSTERVEFAVKIPDKDNKGFIYLPIDSKFPADTYANVLEAAENADAVALKTAIGELKIRIRKEAMTIRDKYIAPPNTTDFAIMFLPTEGLYSEVLRIDGLVEECQEKCKIVIAGPTTLTALLNSLSVGFKYLTVNKKSEEIMKLLGNFKGQFEKFNDLITRTQNRISDAQKAADQLRDRSSMIQKKLDKVELVSYEDGGDIIELPEDIDA